MNKRVWKDIIGYDDMYAVSNFGEVISKERTVAIHSGAKRKIKSRTIKQSIDANGYPYVNLWKDNKGKTIRVHILVATAFVEKQNKTFVVNHKDGDKKNNFFLNLEWISQKENVNHAFNNGLASGSNTGRFGADHNNPKCGKIVMPCGDLLVFKSQADLCREFGLNRSGISRVMLGTQSHHKMWRPFLKQDKLGEEKIKVALGVIGDL